jgi:hypothetical protein
MFLFNYFLDYSSRITISETFLTFLMVQNAELVTKLKEKEQIEEIIKEDSEEPPASLSEPHIPCPLWNASLSLPSPSLPSPAR